MSFLDKVRSLFSIKITNKDKSDEKTVTFDSEGNVISHPSGNPANGTPAEIKRLAKNLYDKIEKLRK